MWWRIGGMNRVSVRYSWLWFGRGNVIVMGKYPVVFILLLIN